MRIALFQARTGIEPEAEAAAIARAAEAKKGGAEMLFTPEMSGLLDRDRARAEPHLVLQHRNPVLSSACEAAREQKLWIHLGSLALKREDGSLANRGFVIDAGGMVRATYDKIHLFDVDLDTGESWRESAAYKAGDAAVVVETPVGMLGLSICYDLRFASLYAALSEAGATVLSIPAAFTVPTGEAHWHVLLRARAIESAAFVIAAAQSGRHQDGRETFGHSLVVGPWGDTLLDMGGEEGLGFAQIETERVTEVRRRLPALAHRRPIPEPRVVR